MKPRQDCNGSGMMFDPKCYEVAEHFLSSRAAEKSKDDLAQHIQDAVETWLEIERDHEEDG